MANAYKSARATGQFPVVEGENQASVEENSPPSAGLPNTQVRFPSPWELHHGLGTLISSAERFSPGLASRVTMSDFSSIVAAVTTTYGLSSPNRVRCSVPPSVLTVMSAAAANLAAAASYGLSPGGRAGPATAKTSKPVPPPRTGKVREGKQKPPGHNSGTDPRKREGAGAKRKAPALDQDDKTRRVLLKKALSAFNSQDEDLKGTYVTLGISEESITHTIRGMSVERIQARPKGIPVLQALGLISEEVVREKFPNESPPPSSFTELYKLGPLATPAFKVVPFPPDREVIATFRKDELPLPLSEAVGVLRSKLTLPRDNLNPVLIPELQGSAPEELYIDAKPPQVPTGLTPLVIRRKGVPERQLTYAEVVSRHSKGSGKNIIRLNVCGVEAQLSGKGKRYPFIRARKTTGERKTAPLEKPKGPEPIVPGTRPPPQGSGGDTTSDIVQKMPPPSPSGAGIRGGVTLDGRTVHMVTVETQSSSSAPQSTQRPTSPISPKRRDGLD